MRHLAPRAVLAGLFAISFSALSVAATDAQDSDKVVISGSVPDEAARAAIVSRLRDLYGDGRVVEQLEVGGVVPPPNWITHISKALGPSLKNVRKGRFAASRLRSRARSPTKRFASKSPARSPRRSTRPTPSTTH